MNQDNENVVQSEKKKKHFPVWLTIVLLLILFAGGILAGLKLAVYSAPSDFINQFFSKPVADEKAFVFASPTPSPKLDDKSAQSQPSASDDASTNKQYKTSNNSKADDNKASAKAYEKEYIGSDEAVAAALKHAKVEEKDATVYSLHREHDDGIVYYEIVFVADGKEYEYEINAITAQVEGWEIERDKSHNKDKIESSQSTSGADTKGITVPENEINEELGAIYDTQILAGASRDEADNAVKEARVKIENNLSKAISEAEAKEIAFKHCGASEDKVSLFKISIDVNKTNIEYDIEFVFDGYEYDYEIDAVSGEVLNYEKEKRK